MSSYLLTYRITILQNAQSVKFFKSEVKVWVTFLTRHVTFMFEEDCGENELESVQFKMRSEMPISQKRFQCSSGWRWPSLVLSRKIVSRFLFQSLSPPCDQWCDVLGFVPAGSVSSFSTDLPKSKHLRGLIFPPVYLLGRFPTLWHVQGSTPTWVFEGGCRPFKHFSLGFPFHSSLFVARSLNLWGWLHMWSDCHLLRQSCGGHGWLLPPPLSSWRLRPYWLHCLHGW